MELRHIEVLSLGFRVMIVWWRAYRKLVALPWSETDEIEWTCNVWRESDDVLRALGVWN